MNHYKIEIYIGDYSVTVWIDPEKDKKLQIANYINSAISQFGLKVVNA